MRKALFIGSVFSGLLGLVCCEAPDSGARSKKATASAELSLVPSCQHPLLRNDASLSGGVVARLPVRSDGAVWLVPTQKDPEREVLVTLHYARQEPEGIIAPRRNMVALTEPRHASLFVHHTGQPQVLTDPSLWARGLDAQALRDARKASPLSIKRSATIGGKPCWWILAPAWGRVHDLAPSHLMGELYWQDPDRGGLPSENIPLAIRPSDGGWRPLQKSYLLTTSTPTQAWAVIERGQLARVETAEVSEPPLKDILIAKETDVASGKWRNRLIIDVKNKSLPKILQEAKTSELSDLVGQIEKLVLDVNHEGELAKDRAQKEIEAARPGDTWREMAVVYKGRIEVLKPMLAAIKEEVANRGK